MSLLFNTDEDELEEEDVEAIQNSKIQDIWENARKNDLTATNQSENQRLEIRNSGQITMEESVPKVSTAAVPDAKQLGTVANVKGITQKEQKPLPPRKSAPPIPPKPLISSTFRAPARNQPNNRELASDMNVQSYIQMEDAQAQIKTSLFSDDNES